MNLRNYRWYRILQFYLCDVLGWHSFTIDEHGQGRCIHCDHKAYVVRDSNGEPECITFRFWWWEIWNSYKGYKRPGQEVGDREKFIEQYEETSQDYFSVCHWIAKKKCPIGSVEGLAWLSRFLANEASVESVQRELIDMEKAFPEGARERYMVTEAYQDLLKKGFTQ